MQDVLFYQLPLHAHFYSELVNAIGGEGAAAHATVTTLFTPEDAGAVWWLGSLLVGTCPAWSQPASVLASAA